MDCPPLFIEMKTTHLRESEEDHLLKLLENFDGPNEVLLHVKILKDEGNLLFKRGIVQAARGIYEQAAKLLCYILPTGTGDMDALQDLIFSLNLDIVACALKLHDFHRAMTLCSLVLDFDPTNVKALFRRDLAAREIGVSSAAYLSLASHDLVKATKIDQKNKDIQQELQVARDAFFASGKRKSGSHEGFEGDYKGKNILWLMEVKRQAHKLIS